MFHVYILQSEKNGSYYIGFAEDVERRLGQHNAGRVKATRFERPYRVVYTEAFVTESEARKRERQIKTWKSRVAIERLIAG